MGNSSDGAGGDGKQDSSMGSDDRGPPPEISLTSRELEGARLAAFGSSVEEIAGLLFVSEHTVKTHLEHVYLKLGVRNRVQLTRVLIAMRENQPDG